MRTKNVIINNCLSKSDWVMTRLESEVERANHMYDESSVWRSKFQFDLSDGEEEEKDSNERLRKKEEKSFEAIMKGLEMEKMFAN